MTAADFIVGFFTTVGAVVCTAAAAALLWYLVTRRPTPDATMREAVGEIRWSYAFALFIAPCAVVGIQEFGGVFGGIVGGFVGSLPVAWMVVLSWWFGPL